MELTVGDLVRHFHNRKWAIVLSQPSSYKGCTVCYIQWLFYDKKVLIDVDFLDKVDRAGYSIKEAIG